MAGLQSQCCHIIVPATVVVYVIYVRNVADLAGAVGSTQGSEYYCKQTCTPLAGYIRYCCCSATNTWPTATLDCKALYMQGVKAYGSSPGRASDARAWSYLQHCGAWGTAYVPSQGSLPSKLQAGRTISTCTKAGCRRSQGSAMPLHMTVMDKGRAHVKMRHRWARTARQPCKP